MIDLCRLQAEAQNWLFANLTSTTYWKPSRHALKINLIDSVTTAADEEYVCTIQFLAHTGIYLLVLQNNHLRMKVTIYQATHTHQSTRVGFLIMCAA